MFLESQDRKQIEYYHKMLQILGSLSNLFSDSPEPYLVYRSVENLFCIAFKAENRSRSDTPADATKGSMGVGIKTFRDGNGNTLQKIAEFNADHNIFKNLQGEEKIYKISELRNARQDAAKRIFKISDLIYHCVSRKSGKIMVYETSSDNIDCDKIRNVKTKNNAISFCDGKDEYSFSISKSTLYKRFLTQNVKMEIPVKIIADPFVIIEKLNMNNILKPVFETVKEREYIILPLYAHTNKDGNFIPEKSGLNQWNASGRPRDPDEVYIPIPSWINRRFPRFFPSRDISFSLQLPNNDVMNAKICQDNNKAIMSNPNSALGKWLLRDVLNLRKRELLTYKALETIGLDSVIINKNNSQNYSIAFTKKGSFERFRTEIIGNDELLD